MEKLLIFLLLMGVGIPIVRRTDAYFADWGVLGGRPHEPTCIDIPKNMSLCADIGYDKMRLPNLLDHDTLTEVQQQSGSWVPLLKIQCHPDTKLFLCSLFTPVCLEKEIFPCRSLCESVKTTCEVRMQNYGYQWPDMLRCERFPEDNDMCIKLRRKEEEAMEDRDEYCSACSPIETYENILDNFCISDHVLRARVSKQRGPQVTLRKAHYFKYKSNPRNPSNPSQLTRTLKRRSKLLLSGNSSCCSFLPGKQKYLIMGKDRVSKRNITFIQPSFVVPLRKSKVLREALRVFRKLDCSDPNLFKPSLTPDGTIVPKAPQVPLESGENVERKEKKKRKQKKGNKGMKGKRRRKKGKRRKNKEKSRRRNRKKKNMRKQNRKEEVNFEAQGGVDIQSDMFF